jgi:putative transposase
MALNRRRTEMASEMASKKHRPEEAVAKLRQVDVLVSQGQSVAEAIRAIGVTEVTYYRWRRDAGAGSSGA